MPKGQTARRLADVDWGQSALFAEALDHAAIVAVTDRGGRIIYCNGRFTDVSGYSRSELIGSTHRLVKSGAHDDAFFTEMFATISSGKVWHGTICNRRKDGELYWVDSTIVPQMNAKGFPDAYLAIRFDVTSHVRALEQLDEARSRLEDALTTKDVFISNMSHEIRTPLNGVVGIAAALARTKLSVGQMDMVGLIEASGRSLERILNDVLDASKLDARRMTLEIRPFDLQSEICAAAHLMRVRADDKGVDFSIAFGPGTEGLFLGDSVRLRQIVANLASNAVKFTDEGRVSISASVSDPVRAGDQGELFVEVRDSGIGFDSAAAPFLFERFSQADSSISRRFGGTGLGLSICKALAELMGGDITVESSPGEGSLFRVRIPIQQAPQVAADVTSPAPPGQSVTDSVRVLLAEDHPVNQKVVQLLLAPYGVDLTIAQDGAEAIDRFRDESYDLILMDMQMPVVDGLQATRSIREIEKAEARSRTPIGMMTANTSETHKRRASESGADIFISKPVTSDVLLVGIDDLLSLRAPPAASREQRKA